MKISKRFLSLALALSISVISTGCANTSTNDDKDVSKNTEVTTEVKEDNEDKRSKEVAKSEKSIDKDSLNNENADYDYEADVVVVGGGASGLTAALKAQQEGSSVIVVEANYDCGGHAATSEGQLHSGGFTSDQEKYDIEDSSDLYYYDHTRGTYVGGRYNDFDYVRSISNSMAESYEFIKDNGVKVLDVEPMVRAYYRDGGLDGDSIGRMTYI